ncbi:MAG: NAD-dependent epimerase/dehydratase family protein [Candidatus Hydrogenedens sp.]|nr:NAD-dependent epimerase/dehydratase family protein [Candidatus Hydrogenedens sp.]
MQKKKILLTGATGILGSWLLAEALRRGYAPVAVIRGDSEATARRRLRQALASADVPGEEEARVTVWLGDNTQAALGLSADQWQTVRDSFAFVLHSAALTSFSQKKAALIHDTNVHGVEQVLQGLGDSGVPLYHVSTSYVAGTPGSPVAYETDLKDEAHCRNPYEHSKREAELLLRAAFEGGQPGAVFRPSIIVGAAQSGSIAQFMNFYQMLRLVDLIETGQLVVPERVRVMADPEANLNIVPVDWVAAALWDIIEQSGATGLTYHLTHPEPPTLWTLSDWARKRLAVKGSEIEFHASLAPEGLTELEQYIHSLSNMFLQYISRSEPLFDRTHTDTALAGVVPFPAVDGALFDRLLDYAHQHQWLNAFERE